MLFYIIILAIVQGLTEFLPVSSSGHLVLLNKIFQIEGDFLLLSVILHVATLLAVIIVLRKEIVQIILHPLSELSKKLIVATIPTVVIVILFKSVIDKAFSGSFLPVCFMFTAVAIVASELLSKKNGGKKEITYKTGIIMGIMQGIAVLPGVSRSGLTICAGLGCGAHRDNVANFSFLMSIPIILASLALEIIEYFSVGQALTIPWTYILIGFIIAFIVGLFSIKFMLSLVKKHSLYGFAVYLAILSIICFFVI